MTPGRAARGCAVVVVTPALNVDAELLVVEANAAIKAALTPTMTTATPDRRPRLRRRAGAGPSTGMDTPRVSTTTPSDGRAVRVALHLDGGELSAVDVEDQPVHRVAVGQVGRRADPGHRAAQVSLEVG